MDNKQFANLTDLLSLSIQGLDIKIHALAVGGSNGNNSKAPDHLSDLDLFAFCDDCNIFDVGAKLVSLILDIFDESLEAHGPFLGDGFGVGHKIYIDDRPAIEIFCNSLSTWRRSPERGKLVFFMLDKNSGRFWEEEVRACLDYNWNSDESTYLYLSRSFSPLLVKAIKYLTRNEDIAALSYIFRLQDIEWALLYSELYSPLVSRDYITTIYKSEGLKKSQNLIMLRQAAITSPGIELDRIVNALRSVPPGRFGERTTALIEKLCNWVKLSSV